MGAVAYIALAMYDCMPLLFMIIMSFSKETLRERASVTIIRKEWELRKEKEK